MTERMEPFHRQAITLGTHARATSFVVNSAWLLHQLGVSPEEAEQDRLVMGYAPHRHGLRTSAAKAPGSPDLRLFTIRVLLE